MEKIKAFRGTGYSESLNPLDNYITLPFDEIDNSIRGKYLKRSEYNFARIILPDEGENPLHKINHFLSYGIFREDPEEKVYPYEQEFMINGKKYVRKSFIGVLNLDYAIEHVHPHEKIFEEPKQERLSILSKTGYDLEPIFLLYKGENCHDYDDDPVAWGEEPAGVIHRLYSVNYSGECVSDEFVIADGHHRFSAALEFYKIEKRAGWILAAFVNMEQDSIFILPSYKLVKNVRLDIGRFNDYFEIEVYDDVPEKYDDSIIMIWNEKYFRLRFRGKERINAIIFEKIIMEKILRRKINMEGVRTFRSMDGLKMEKNDVAFLFSPPTPQQVWDMAMNGMIMPQKSTYFYPKIASGLRIFRKL